MNPMLIVSAVLLASLAGNAWLFGRMNDAQADAVRAESARKTAVSAGQACDKAVEDLLTKGLRQAAEAADAIEAARLEGEKAGRRAQLERTRPQAVPGKVCESAAAETADWLKRRQGAAK